MYKIEFPNLDKEIYESIELQTIKLDEICDKKLYHFYKVKVRRNNKLIYGGYEIEDDDEYLSHYEFYLNSLSKNMYVITKKYLEQPCPCCEGWYYYIPDAIMFNRNEAIKYIYDNSINNYEYDSEFHGYNLFCFQLIEKTYNLNESYEIETFFSNDNHYYFLTDLKTKQHKAFPWESEEEFTKRKNQKDEEFKNSTMKYYNSRLEELNKQLYEDFDEPTKSKLKSEIDQINNLIDRINKKVSQQ